MITVIPIATFILGRPMDGRTAEVMTMSGITTMTIPAQALGLTTNISGLSTQELQKGPLIQRLILGKVMTASQSIQRHHRAPQVLKTLNSLLVTVMTPSRSLLNQTELPPQSMALKSTLETGMTP